jgi:thiamine pyrophosphokinase
VPSIDGVFHPVWEERQSPPRAPQVPEVFHGLFDNCSWEKYTTKTIKSIIPQGKTCIAAADSGLALAEAAGLKPDWIIGDMDSLNHDRLCHYPMEKIIRYPVDKNYTDTELALALLREKGCGEIWIIGGGGGRIDHLFGIRELFEGDDFPTRWLTAAEDIYCIEGGKLAISLAPGSVVSVFLVGGGPWKAESAGLKWPLDNVRWKRGMTGLSNIATTGTDAGPDTEADEGKIEINSKQGRFMIILEDIWRQ